MMSFDQTGYILYPAPVKRNKFQLMAFKLLSPPGALQFPSIPASRMTLAVSRRPTDAKAVVARKRENWATFSETDERYTVTDERI
jgi:hypothetical protein